MFMMSMRCNKVLYFDIITICDNMCIWTSWVHIFEYLVLLSKLGATDDQDRDPRHQYVSPTNVVHSIFGGKVSIESKGRENS